MMSVFFTRSRAIAVDVSVIDGDFDAMRGKRKRGKKKMCKEVVSFSSAGSLSELVCRGDLKKSKHLTIFAWSLA